MLKMIILFCSLVLTGCETYNCETLRSKAKNPDISKYLLSWFDSTIAGKELDQSNFLSGGGMVPGRYRMINPNVEWAELGLGGKPQVRILSDRRLGDENYFSNIESVFAGRHSGFGYLVRANEESSFFLKGDDIHQITNRISVICTPMD